MSFAVDSLTGAIFRRRDLTLVRFQDWAKRVKGHRAVVIDKPALPQQPLGNVASLVDTLFNEDEKLIRVDFGTWPPADRLALVTVRNGKIEGLPVRTDSALRDRLLEAAKKAPGSVSNGQTQNSVEVVSAPETTIRPERETSILQDDLILGGAAHENHIRGLLRKARRHVVIHSTFLNLERFEGLLPDIRVAVGRGCRLDILWGHSSLSGELVKSLREAEKIQGRLAEIGLSGSAHVHASTTRSHAKILLADDGASGATATVGSCNWLYSGFKSFEASVRLRDPRLVADMLYEMGELARPSDGHIPELTARLAQWGREIGGRPGISGNAKVRVVVGDEHDRNVLLARDNALRQITVLSHRLGVVAKPAILIPVASAVRSRSIEAKLYYGEPSGPVKSGDASQAQFSYREQGVDLIAIQRPRIHAKVLMWDDDDVVVSSLNWLSADTHSGNPRQEIGIAITRPNIAEYFRAEFDRMRLFAGL